MKRKLGIVFAISVLVATATVCFAGAGTGLVVDPEGAGDSAPDFTLKLYGTDETVTLSDHIGKKVIMLEFWATWCNICVKEMPELVKEYNELKPKGYEVFAITLSPGDEKDLGKIGKLKEKHNIPYPILLDTNFQVAQELYKLSGPIPLKLIIDCNGKLRYEHVGDFPEGSEVPYVVEALLAEGNCKPE